MFTYVMVGANDLAASKKFCDAVLGVGGLSAAQAGPKGRIFYGTNPAVRYCACFSSGWAFSRAVLSAWTAKQTMAPAANGSADQM
jgi:hypothetical protein